MRKFILYVIEKSHEAKVLLLDEVLQAANDC